MKAHTPSAHSKRARVSVARSLLGFFAVVLMVAGVQLRAEAQVLDTFNVAVGQQAILAFGGAAGQITQRDLTSNFFSWIFQLKNASSTAIWSSSVTSATTSVTIPELPADGNYSLVLTPLSTRPQGLQYIAGAVTANASLVAGSPVAIHVGPTNPLGAYVRIPFSATAGEYISVTTGSAHRPRELRAERRRHPADVEHLHDARRSYLPIKFTGNSGQGVTMKTTTASCYGFSTSTYYSLIRPDRTIMSSEWAGDDHVDFARDPADVRPVSAGAESSGKHVRHVPVYLGAGYDPYSFPSTQSCTIQVTSP